MSCALAVGSLFLSIISLRELASSAVFFPFAAFPSLYCACFYFYYSLRCWVYAHNHMPDVAVHIQIIRSLVQINFDVELSCSMFIRMFAHHISGVCFSALESVQTRGEDGMGPHSRRCTLIRVQRHRKISHLQHQICFYWMNVDSFMPNNDKYISINLMRAVWVSIGVAHRAELIKKKKLIRGLQNDKIVYQLNHMASPHWCQQIPK